MPTKDREKRRLQKQAQRSRKRLAKEHEGTHSELTQILVNPWDEKTIREYTGTHALSRAALIETFLQDWCTARRKGLEVATLEPEPEAARTVRRLLWVDPTTHEDAEVATDIGVPPDAPLPSLIELEDRAEPPAKPVLKGKRAVGDKHSRLDKGGFGVRKDT